MLHCVKRIAVPQHPGAGRVAGYTSAMTLIRKYGNRRLYDTQASRYINLDDLAALVRGGEEVKVVDAKTEEDLTREVLLQVILELQGGLDFLPVALLRRIIRATGDEPAQRLLRQQLSTAFELLHAQFDRLEAQFGTLFPGFFGGGRPTATPSPKPAPTPPPEEPEAPEEPPSAAAPKGEEPAAEPAGDELDALRARLAALEKRLKRG
jgi:polyhydroxyalkanoate synthesis repressor PhaR